MKVGSDLIEQTNQAILTDLDKFLRPTPFVKISSFLLGDEYLSIADMQSLSAFMHIILESYPQLTNTYLADNNGNMFIENRIKKNEPLAQQVIPFISGHILPADSSYISEIITRSNNIATIAIKYKKMSGDVIKTDFDKHLTFDPRTRPWYLGAKDLKDEPWIGIYKFYGMPRQGVTIAFPIYSGEKFVGVAAADLSIGLIETELKKFSRSNKGVVFIVNNHEQIIAYDNKHTALADMPTIKTVNNPLITASYQIFRQTGKSKFEFEYNKVKYIANFKQYGFSKTEHWEIATVLPDDIFIGSIKIANKNTLAFSLLMLLVGLIFVIVSSHKISQPIIHLAKETKDIIKLRFNKKTHIKTHIYEVQVMIDALNAAKAALSSFAKYVPKTLVEQLIQTRMIAQLGGKKQTISVLFSDVENFTELSENVDPEFLMIHFSEYLNAVTHIIQHHKGNIDKYIGDAVMAFWGAPVADSKHAMHACQAILACQQAVNNMNEEWQQAGKPIFPTRFGLNTGMAIVGNMGSSDRLNYTALGDTVNLAARLETLNKVFGTHVIVSESVYEICANQFLFRPLDVVTVRGKHLATSVYELVAGKPDALDYPATARQVELCNLFSEAYHSYHQENYGNAIKQFRYLMEKFPEDKMSQIYFERCQERLNF